MPTLKAMWSPKGQQVMIPTPAQPTKRYGIGAVETDILVLVARGLCSQALYTDDKYDT